MKPYATLTTAEQRQWHIDVYAFRRAVLGVSHDEHTSPPDPKGEFFDERAVAEAQRRLHAKLNGQKP